MNESFVKAKELMSKTLFDKAPAFEAGADFGYLLGKCEIQTKLNKAKEFIESIEHSTDYKERARQILKEL